LNPLPIDRIPEPKYKPNDVAIFSLPTTLVTHTNNNEGMDFQSQSGVCLRVAGFQPNEIFDGAIIGNDEITSKIFTKAPAVTY
jgi:hypothetical protein